MIILSSFATPFSVDGTSGSIIEADNARTSSETVSDRMLDFLVGTNGVATWLFFDGRKGPASVAAFFLTAYMQMSAADTRVLVRITAIKIKRSMQNSKINKKKKSEMTDYVIPKKVTELSPTS